MSNKGYTTKKCKRKAVNNAKRKQKAKKIAIAKQKSKELYNKQMDFVMSRNEKQVNSKIKEHNRKIFEQNPALINQLLATHGNVAQAADIAKEAGLITVDNYHAVSTMNNETMEIEDTPITKTAVDAALEFVDGQAVALAQTLVQPDLQALVMAEEAGVIKTNEFSRLVGPPDESIIEANKRPFESEVRFVWVDEMAEERYTIAKGPDDSKPTNN